MQFCAVSSPFPRALCLVLVALSLNGCGDGAGSGDAGIPSNQCVSPADRSVLDGTATDGGQSLLVDGGLGVSAALGDLVWTCAQDGCPNEILAGATAETDSCMRACFASTEIASLSPGCQDCWTLYAVCGAAHCASPCLGTDPALCETCMTDNCLATRESCTGL